MQNQSPAEKRRVKLGELVELEGCAGLDELLEAAALDSVSPAICLNRRVRLHGRDGAGPGARIVRGVRHQHGCLGTRFGGLI